jgi:uncharacterized protein (DUF433 family)
MTKILCTDGVEREDTPEQAEERAKHRHAVRYPEKFRPNGVPYAPERGRTGAQNKITVRVKKAIMGAAEIVGHGVLVEARIAEMRDAGASPEDIEHARKNIESNAEERLLAFFVDLATREKKVFGTLMARLLPTQITGDEGGPVVMQYTTRRELYVAYMSRGLPPPQWLKEAVDAEPDAALFGPQQIAAQPASLSKSEQAAPIRSANPSDPLSKSEQAAPIRSANPSDPLSKSEQEGSK